EHSAQDWHEPAAELTRDSGEQHADEQIVTGPVPLMQNALLFLEFDHANHHHWNIAFLLRAQLKLDRPIVEEVIAALLRHHDALRLRFTRDGSRWTQTISPPSEPLPLTWVDLADLPAEQHAARIESVAAQQQRSLNLFTGPVFSVTVFAAGPDQPDHLLVIVHHLVADAFSLRILLADFATAYQQRHAGHSITLPPKSTSFQAWAERMYAFAQSDAIRADLQYWQALPWNEMLPIPLDRSEITEPDRLMSEQRFCASLTRGETEMLHEQLLPAYGVSVQEVLLAALAVAVADWKGSRLVSADVLNFGREPLFADLDLSRTVGYLTLSSVALLDLRAAHTPDEILRAVRDQLRAIPHQGLSHSLLARVTEDAEARAAIAALPQRDVFFNYMGHSRPAPTGESFFQTVQAPLGRTLERQQDRGMIPAITAAIAGEQLELRIHYSAANHDAETIERLARACITTLRRFIRFYQEQPGDHHTPAGDIPVPLMPNMHRSFETVDPERHIWNISTLLEVSAPLDPGRLQEALKIILSRHDALRLRSVESETGWQQHIAADAEEIPFTRIDLTTVHPSEQTAEIESLATMLQASLDITHGPLIRIAQFELGPGQSGRLLILVHHTVCDGYSWQIILEDIFRAYNQLGEDRAPQLPPLTTSYQEYTSCAAAYARSPELHAELDYWRSALEGATTPLPVDHRGGQHTGASAQRLSVALTPEETDALLERAEQISVNEALLTALALSFGSWTGAQALLIDVVRHGRNPVFGPLDLSRTVGWFDYLVPLRLRLSSSESVEATAQQIQAQLQEIPHDGMGYGLLRYLSPDADVRAALQAIPSPQVLFNYRGQIAGDTSRIALPIQVARESAGRDHSSKVIRPHLLLINAQIANRRLEVHWEYSDQVHRRETIERLAQECQAILRSLSLKRHSR
ncbi:MAG TPA: condensation domain-containing protein, partial [Herpetosiphonaceae bacterium]